ncbi:MAG: nucleotidyltransferase family protein [Wenzhouxiangellaceae bacterium]
MKAMILAAGRGERMRPLTDHTPKPLLMAGDQPLIGHHILRLKAAGFSQLVINTSYLAEQIHQQLGDGSGYGVSITYSDEPQPALETGGGIVNALPLLGEGRFLVINGDVWCDYPLHRLRQVKTDHAHLLLVDNPGHHPQGDFSLEGLRVLPAAQQTLTYSGIAVFDSRFFAGMEPGRFSLGPILHQAAAEMRLTGEYYRGQWLDVGTVERLNDLRERFTHKASL